MPATPTNYPFRQALSQSIQAIVVQVALPAVNAMLTAQYAAQGTPSGSQVQLTASNVRLGDVPVPSAPVICITAGRREQGLAAVKTFDNKFWTAITFKLPNAGDSFPESYEMLKNVLEDTLFDALSNEQAGFVPGVGFSAYRIDPAIILPTSPLPAGTRFGNCYLTAAMPLSPVAGADKVTIYQRFAFTHEAELTVNLNRPGALTLPA